MSLSALLLVVAGATIHATWNTLAKRGGNQFLFLWLAAGLGAVMLAIPAAVMVLGQGFATAAVPYIAGSAVAHALYFFTLGRAYSHGDLSTVYPVSRGLGIALVAVLAWPLIGEPPTPAGAGGVIAVILGVALVARRPAQRASRPALTGLGWAAVTGLIVATYSLIDKRGTSYLAPLPYLVTVTLGACLLLVPAVVRLRSELLREWRHNRRSISIAAGFTLTAYVLILHAMQKAPVAYVVATREISIVMSVIIGRLWLNEHPSWHRVVGAVVITGGVVCLSVLGAKG